LRLENSFSVQASPEAAWDLLLDVPRVIPCMLGAQLLEVVDESAWKARMDVKIGPVALAFDTDVSRESVDGSGRRVTLAARARERRGRGGAQATVDSSLTTVDGATRIDIVTNLTLSGSVAQYGRGMVQALSTQLVGRFAECLEAQLVASPAEV
jgi:carbon monoxide dehydrogenase subunit G